MHEQTPRPSAPMRWQTPLQQSVSLQHHVLPFPSGQSARVPGAQPEKHAGAPVIGSKPHRMFGPQQMALALVPPQQCSHGPQQRDPFGEPVRQQVLPLSGQQMPSGSCLGSAPRPQQRAAHRPSTQLCPSWQHVPLHGTRLVGQHRLGAASAQYWPELQQVVPHAVVPDGHSQAQVSGSWTFGAVQVAEQIQRHVIISRAFPLGQLGTQPCPHSSNSGSQ